MTKKGFTLIELLVVITIIGFLASVVLAALNVSRNKAADSAIQSNLRTVRSVSELYYGDNDNSYGNPFEARSPCPDPFGGLELNMFSENKVIEIITASLALSVPGAQETCAIGPNGQTWALSVPLKTGGSWCVSSVGISKTGVADGGDTAAAFCN